MNEIAPLLYDLLLICKKKWKMKISYKTMCKHSLKVTQLNRENLYVKLIDETLAFMQKCFRKKNEKIVLLIKLLYKSSAYHSNECTFIVPYSPRSHAPPYSWFSPQLIRMMMCSGLIIPLYFGIIGRLSHNSQWIRIFTRELGTFSVGLGIFILWDPAMNDAQLGCVNFFNLNISTEICCWFFLRVNIELWIDDNNWWM